MSEKLHSFFAGTISLKEASGGLWRVSGYAIHPMKTFHPKEWPTIRNYLEPYLINAAPTLAGKPFLIDHARTLSPQNCLTLGKWDTEKCGVYYEGNVTEDVALKIKSGRIKGVSVGVDFEKIGSGLVITESGCIPYAYGFDEVSFLENMSPGDPQATIQLWEGILKEANEGKLPWHVEMSSDAEIGLLADQIYAQKRAKATEENRKEWDEFTERKNALEQAMKQINTLNGLVKETVDAIRRNPLAWMKEAEVGQDFIVYPIQSLDIFLLDCMQVMWINQEKGVQGIYGALKAKPESLQPYCYLFAKARDWDDKKIQAWLVDNPQYAKSAQTPQPVGITQSTPIIKESVEKAVTVTRTPHWAEEDNILVTDVEAKSPEQIQAEIERQKTEAAEKLRSKIVLEGDDAFFRVYGNPPSRIVEIPIKTRDEERARAEKKSVKAIKDIIMSIEQKIAAFKNAPETKREIVLRNLRSQYDYPDNPRQKLETQKNLDEIMEAYSETFEKMAKAIPHIEEIKTIYQQVLEEKVKTEAVQQAKMPETLNQMAKLSKSAAKVYTKIEVGKRISRR